MQDYMRLLVLIDLKIYLDFCIFQTHLSKALLIPRYEILLKPVINLLIFFKTIG